MNRRTLAFWLCSGQVALWIAILCFLANVLLRYSSRASADVVLVASLLAVGAGIMLFFFGLQALLLGIEAEAIGDEEGNVKLKSRFLGRKAFEIERSQLRASAFRVISLDETGAVEKYVLAWDPKNCRLFSVRESEFTKLDKWFRSRK